MGTKYKIESGVPMPETRGRHYIYPFAEMNVGDSFAVAASDVKLIRTSASHFGLRHKQKYSILCIDPIKGDYRCWRIA